MAGAGSVASLLLLVSSSRRMTARLSVPVDGERGAATFKCRVGHAPLLVAAYLKKLRRELKLEAHRDDDLRASRLAPIVL